MASSSLNDSLRTFAKRPTGQKVAFFAGGIAVVGLLYYQLVYSGLSDDLQNQKTQNTQLTQQNKQLQARERKYKELVKLNDELKEQLIKNRISLPTSAELPAFFVHLQKQAAASGVSINNWRRRREIPIGTSYVKVPVAMTITGTYYQILHYFKLLGETDRIITVESLNLGNGKVRGDETILRASFLASTFRLPGDGSDDLFQGEPEEEAATKKPATLKERAQQKVEDAREGHEEDVAEQSDNAEGAGSQPSGNGNAGAKSNAGGGNAP